jgi:hypothetical protein
MTKVKRFGVRRRGGAGTADPSLSPVIDFTLLSYTEAPDGGIIVSAELLTEREIDEWATDVKASVDSAVPEAKSALRHARLGRP